MTDLQTSGEEDLSLTQKNNDFSQSLQDWINYGEEIEKNLYAVLYPMTRGIQRIDLHTEFFEFGRHPEREESYSFYELVNQQLRSSISGRHCLIQRNFAENRTYLHDTSRFGTFVNEKMIGFGSKRVLSSGDLISMGDAKFHVFMYAETSQQFAGHPKELTDKYLISNVIIGEGAMGKPNCVYLEYVCETPSFAYIVMEYVEGGELFNRIVDEVNEGKGIGENLTKFYAWQILNALSYLHKNNIVHRDVKPENVLLLKREAFTVVKLTDFGLSKYSESSLQTFCGTKVYMAPELFESTPRYGPKVDIWAFGTVIFIAIVGYPPFSSDYLDMPLRDQICKGRLIMRRDWNNVSLEAKQLIRSTINVNTEERLTAEEALQHEWFNDPLVEKAKQIVHEHYISSHSFEC